MASRKGCKSGCVCLCVFPLPLTPLPFEPLPYQCDYRFVWCLRASKEKNALSTQNIGAARLDSTNGHMSPTVKSLPDNPANAPINRFTTPNQPNARKMIHSMRHLGYNNYAAVKDIVDNCNDAEATWVHVMTHPIKSSGYNITIADNGLGMDWDTLDEALKLGSDTERNVVSDLGKFGMGLVTASLSICRRVEVITKQKGGDILHSIQDIDEVDRQNDFVKFLDFADEEAILVFESLLPNAESGTVVRLINCDHLSNIDSRSFANKLRKEMGQTYRIFLATDERVMFVDDVQVQPKDPLMLAEGGEIQSDETYSTKYVDALGTEREDTFRVRIALLPDFGQEGNTDRGINVPNQGIYLLRNFREIAAGETLGIKSFTKHNDFNRIRAEVYFPATLDDLMGVDFTKQKPEPSQAMLDQLGKGLISQIKALRGRIKSTRAKIEDGDVTHDEAARLIGQKAHLLAKPKLDVEDRKSLSPKKEQIPGNKGGTKERKNFAETKPKPVSLPCRFETASMTPVGPIWHAEQEGKTLVLTWNVDHLFYQRFVLDNKENLSIVHATDFLVYSLAVAELVYNNDDDEDTFEKRQAMMQNIQMVVSNNMRQLLS